MRSVVAGRTLLDVAGPPAGIVTTAPGSVPSPAGITPLGPRTIQRPVRVVGRRGAGHHPGLTITAGAVR